MNMFKFPIGKVVQSKLTGYPFKYGHVIGFGLNDRGESLLKVQWEHTDQQVKYYRRKHADLIPNVTFIHPMNVKT